MIDISKALARQVGDAKESLEKNLQEIKRNFESHQDALVEVNSWILIALLVLLILIIFAIIKKKNPKTQRKGKKKARVPFQLGVVMLEKVKRSGFPEFYFVLNLIFHVTKKRV